MFQHRFGVLFQFHFTCKSLRNKTESKLFYFNWMAPWKNRISSTSTKLIKSPIKPVTWQNIWSCSVPSPEIVMHDAFNVIRWTTADICVIVHDVLGWKNRTTRYILPRHWLHEWFSHFHRCGTYSVLSRSPSIVKKVRRWCAVCHDNWSLKTV